MSRYIIFGASRGLGNAISQIVSDGELLLISRNKKLLAELSKKTKVKSNIYTYDFTDLDNFEELALIVKNYDPTHIYYVAGGGPYGKYEQKQFKDHLWAFKLNLLFPAQLVHWALNNLSLKQMILVGSSVAEASADPLAASYASAKHGLKGLVSSLNSEACGIDLRLFSPPYMDTDLLPNGSHPHLEGKVGLVSNIANLFYNWANDADGLKHYFIEVE